MFTLQDSYTYWWPVKVIQPDPDQPGKTVEKHFKMRFEAPEKESAEAFDKTVDALFEERAKVRDGRTGSFDREIEVLVRYCHDWQDVVDPNDTAIPFSPEALRRALGHPAIAAGISRAWHESVESGGARLGN